MSTTKNTTAIQDLIDAANVLLLNAQDTGECLVDEDKDFEEDEYPIDEDGDAWYHDWWEMKQALHRCDTEAVNNLELMDSLDNLAFEAKGFMKELAKHGVDGTCLLGAIRRAEKTIKKARGG